MRIGLLITSIGNFGQKGFYNAQEIGLAKALDKLFEEVTVYKLVSVDQEAYHEHIEGSRNANLNIIPSKNIGSNGIIDIKCLDKSLDALLYFSDTQISLPSVYKWTQKNNIRFFPYIGVLTSHSSNRIKRLVTDTLFRRNLQIYKKSQCLVKTPKVKKELHNLGVEQIIVTPVGLDLSLVHAKYAETSTARLKVKYGYTEYEKVILFIGRFVKEKQPAKMIEIFDFLQKNDKNYRLIMVGTGELKENMIAKVKDLELVSKVQFLDRIPNNEIWKLYRIADVFLNLNQQEIFGMSILEAMFYECKVVAWKSPGPELIIEDGISGYLVESNEKLIEKIKDNTNVTKNAHKRVVSTFIWENMANIVFNALKLNG